MVERELRDAPIAGPSKRRAPITTSDSSPDALPSRKKRYSVSRVRSCEACRTARAKCSCERPRCARCLRMELECTYEGGETQEEGKEEVFVSPRQSTTSTQPLPLPDHDRLASKAELHALLDAFFEKVYHIPHMSFIHRGQFTRQLESNRASPMLVKSVCAVAFRFLPGADSSHPEGGSLPSTWAQQAKAALMLGLERFSSSKLAATLCILHHEFNSGRTGSAWIFTGIAARMALAMGLNVEHGSRDMPWIERETRRRLMWATYCADRFSSSGWPEYTMLKMEDIHIWLPCDERNFTLGMEAPGETFGEYVEKEDRHDSLLNRWIWLMAIRHDLLGYLWQISSIKPAPWEANSIFEQLVVRLRHWKDTLPAALDFTVDNIYARKGTHELDALLVLHVSFDIIHSTLYRSTLPGFTESARPEMLVNAPREWISQVRQAAYHRARSAMQKLAILRNCMPSHISVATLLNLHIFSSVRVQLQYLALNGVGGDPDPLIQLDTTEGFEMMAHIIGRMGEYFSGNRVLLRDMIRILSRHGYNLYPPDESAPPSGTRTPNAIAGTLSGFPTLPARQFGTSTSQHKNLVDRSEEEDAPALPQMRTPPIHASCRSATAYPQAVIDPISASVPGLPPSHAVQKRQVQSQLPFTGGKLPFEPLQGDHQNDYLSPSDPLAWLFDSGGPSTVGYLNIWDQSTFAEPAGEGPLSRGLPFLQPFAEVTSNSWTAESDDIDWDLILGQRQ